MRVCVHPAQLQAAAAGLCILHSSSLRTALLHWVGRGLCQLPVLHIWAGSALLAGCETAQRCTLSSRQSHCPLRYPCRRMDENLTVFADVTGGCERILRTPVPLMYTRHNSRFLMIWCALRCTAPCHAVGTAACCALGPDGQAARHRTALVFFWLPCLACTARRSGMRGAPLTLHTPVRLPHPPSAGCRCCPSLYGTLATGPPCPSPPSWPSCCWVRCACCACCGGGGGAAAAAAAAALVACSAVLVVPFLPLGATGFAGPASSFSACLAGALSQSLRMVWCGIATAIRFPLAALQASRRSVWPLRSPSRECQDGPRRTGVEVPTHACQRAASLAQPRLATEAALPPPHSPPPCPSPYPPQHPAPGGHLQHH